MARTWMGFGVALAVSLACATAAQAAPVGGLTARDCITGQSAGCATNNVPWLDDAEASAVSPDGRSVYVASQNGSAVQRFTRNVTTGALTYVECYAASACDKPAGGTTGSGDVAVSADGRSVFVSGFGSDALAIFDRDATTGELTFTTCFTGGFGCPGAGANDHKAGLDGAASVAVSRDGQSVYVAAQNSNSLALFDRDPASRAVTYSGCFTFNDAATTNCGGGANQAVGGLGTASGVAVSDDNTSVYVVGSSSQGIAMFNRDPSTRTLTRAGCFTQGSGCGGANDSKAGLDGAHGVAVSPDNRSIVVASQNPGGVVMFERDPATRAVTYRGCFTSGSGCTAENDLTALARASDVAVSADGRSVYVAAENGDSVTRFDRDVVSHALTQRGCFTQLAAGCSATGVFGLDGARGVAVSPNGASVYVTSRTADAVVRLDRAPDAAPGCAPPDAVATQAGVPVRVVLSCSDANADPYAVTVTGSPAHGALTLTSDDTSAVYTPDAGFAGQDGFSVRPVQRNGPAGDVSRVVVDVAPAVPPAPGPALRPRITSTLTHDWGYTERYTLMTEFVVNDVQPGTTIAISCKGGGCPPKSKLKSIRVAKTKRHINLAKPFHNRKLRVGTVIQVRITKPGYVGRLLRYTIRRNKRPKSSPTCLAPGTTTQMTCPI